MIVDCPIEIAGIPLRNRIIMPPMATEHCPEGKVTPRLLAHYRRLSEADFFGLIVVEHAYVSSRGRATPRQLSVSQDSDIEGLMSLVDTIHDTGTPAVLQISHGGTRCKESVIGIPPHGPTDTSERSRKYGNDVPVAMTRGDIQSTTEDFVKAAERAKEAGFDGVEVHCAHGYLLNSFYSPLVNSRMDDYGGTVRDRIRFTEDIVRGIKQRVGIPIFVRFGAEDHLEGGNGPLEAAQACSILENAGADVFDVSGGMCGYSHPSGEFPGYFADSSKNVKAHTSKPVILTGGIKKIDDAESFLKNGCADLIGVGRHAFRNNEWKTSFFNHNKG